MVMCFERHTAADAGSLFNSLTVVFLFFQFLPFDSSPEKGNYIEPRWPHNATRIPANVYTY